MSLGVAELEAGAEPLGRARRQGGGRKQLAETDPGLVPALLALVEPERAGRPGVAAAVDDQVDPEPGCRADPARGTGVGADTVAQLLHEQGFSLQGNAKTIEGKQHPDRDAQFRYINAQARALPGRRRPGDQRGHQEEGAGRAVRQRRPGLAAQGRPGAGPRPRLPRRGSAKAIPYGIYDLAANAGWVNVGTDHDTAAFAVESIRRWWQARGQRRLPRLRGGC